MNILTDNLTGKERRAARKAGTLKQARATQRVTRKAKTVVRRKKIKTTIASALLAPLLPFKKAMVANLKGKGVATSGLKFATIVEKFYNENISKKNRKDSNYDEIIDGFILNSHSMSEPADDSANWDDFEPATIGLIVTAVVTFFKKRKAEKKKLEDEGTDPKDVMTDSDLAIAEATEAVEIELGIKSSADTSIRRGDMKKIIIYVIIAAIIVGGIYYLTKRGK